MSNEIKLSYVLPQPQVSKTLPVPHFPAPHQTLIFRLWDMIPACKLARVLQTSEENILSAGDAMGLGPQRICPEWLTRGYISIIKAVWNLLPYEQLCDLLDWDADRLAYILKEDDFLGGKLGEKCHCPPVLYRELIPEEQTRTAAIRKTMLETVRPLDGEETARPFDFYRSTYAPLTEPVRRAVAVDSAWTLELPEDSGAIGVFVADFKAFAKKYGVEFADRGEKKLRILLDLQTDDEEYRELTIAPDAITLRAGHPVGVLRGLYDLEDLAESAGTFTFEPKVYRRKTRVKSRVIYSFSSLYTGALDRDTADSFPDELLEGYGRRGINGIWMQAILYELAPYPFAPNLCRGWEKRLANLEALTRRAARYGIKVYLYINEPRNLPTAAFGSFPHLKGANLRDGWNCLCSSQPETHEYMRSALQTVCGRVPALGGFITITQSENRVLCCSLGIRTPMERRCPVCDRRKGSDINADMLGTMASAIPEHMKLFAFAWNWSEQLGQDDADALIGKLPANIILLQVSESLQEFDRGGIHGYVRDYSMSVIGPGEPAKNQWKTARQRGLEVAAKVQINNTWECSSVPYLPVYENVAQHMQNLIGEGIGHMMLSWTLGGYISDNIKIASACFFEGDASDYEAVLQSSYGPWAGTVKEAVSHFCKGFSEYPFNLRHIYRGPSNAGAANLFYPEPTGMKATMTGFPYDDLTGWCCAHPGDELAGTPYPPEILENQYRKLCEQWEKGLAVLKDMPTCEFYDMALYGYTLFKSTHNHIRYVRQRDGERNAAIMRDAVASERELALLAYRIMLRNAAVGFEAANHYYVTRANLAEKLVQCDYLLETL